MLGFSSPLSAKRRYSSVSLPNDILPRIKHSKKEKVTLTLLRVSQLHLNVTMSLPHWNWICISPIPLRLIAYVQCVGWPWSLSKVMFAMVGTWHVTDKQPIGTSLLGHAQWTKWLQFTLFLNPPHFLKDSLHILSILYITSVPGVERTNVQLR